MPSTSNSSSMHNCSNVASSYINSSQLSLANTSLSNISSSVNSSSSLSLEEQPFDNLPAVVKLFIGIGVMVCVIGGVLGIILVSRTIYDYSVKQYSTKFRHYSELTKLKVHNNKVTPCELQNKPNNAWIDSSLAETIPNVVISTNVEEAQPPLQVLTEVISEPLAETAPNIAMSAYAEEAQPPLQVLTEGMVSDL